MQLIADRFVLRHGDTALDLATAAEVTLTVRDSVGEQEERRWVLACDEACRWHKRAVPRLLDFGLTSGSRRFEARRTASPSRRLGASPGSPDLLNIPRRVVASIGEALEHREVTRPRCLALWGPDGSGKHTVIEDIARAARQHGFVPIAASLLAAFVDALRGRRLLIIDSDIRGTSRVEWLVASLHAPRPHVLLLVGLRPLATIASVPVEPVSPEALIRAVGASRNKPPPSSLRRLARRSGGWPGRFARLLWRLPLSTVPSASPRYDDRLGAEMGRGMRAAEQPAVYGARCQPPVTALSTQSRRRSVSRGLEHWRDRLTVGASLVDAGRHAPGERTLREALAALSRRDDWLRAGKGGLVLAALLVRRGRAAAAEAAVRDATECLRRAGDEAALVDAAVLAATVSIELARLDLAETSASAAMTAARSQGSEERTVRASLVLARSLIWRARFDEADATLRSATRGPMEPAAAVRLAALEVRVAIGLGDFRRAMSRAADACAVSRRHGEARLAALAASTAALTCLAMGDLQGVDREVGRSVAAARTSHDPLVAAKSRLIQAEAFRRSNRRTAAQAVLRRISRVQNTHVPPIVRARCDLLRDLLSSANPSEDVLERHVAATGLGGLALFGNAAHSSNRRTMSDPTIATIIDILDLCQTSDDERGVIGEVCRRLRERMQAVATAIVVDEEGRRAPVGSDGSRIDVRIAERAMEAGLALSPHRFEDRIEAAVPIRSGGAVIGAFCARWSIGTPNDLGFASALMTAVAATIAPVVVAAVARSRRLCAPPLRTLLGASAAMADVRRAIERAAPAPFAVLIQGESGSGKELVARALHMSSPRRNRPLCTLNCAALPEDLVEAELFGHVRGAFTGAVAERPGVFEEAHGGTLFLDEVGELSLRAQAKLLRVIQEGELRRVGDTQSRRIDVRIVSATNRHLPQEVAEGRFRLDLLYRLDVVRIGLPPLRERREDIPLLAEHFWREAALRVNSRATLAPSTLDALRRYDWPGNVRELQNALASLAVGSAKRGIVQPAALGGLSRDVQSATVATLEDARRSFDEQFVRAALARVGGHRARAAAELGVSRQGLTKLMLRLGIR